ncbi:unnamed protein product [Moneuplotes crassus]|uniref:C3H1-type domain-containing protein n=1 Tax=Euplotes crassus TaxID=5936 RepID=A0AAD1UK21_EUPCR|nr:unnamed protein product [Moneuplotes crassus]
MEVDLIKRIRAKKSLKDCKFWVTRGWCRHDDNCKFIHDPDKQAPVKTIPFPSKAAEKQLEGSPPKSLQLSKRCFMPPVRTLKPAEEESKKDIIKSLLKTTEITLQRLKECTASDISGAPLTDPCLTPSMHIANKDELLSGNIDHKFMKVKKNLQINFVKEFIKLRDNLVIMYNSDKARVETLLQNQSNDFLSKTEDEKIQDLQERINTKDTRIYELSLKIQDLKDHSISQIQLEDAKKKITKLLLKNKKLEEQNKEFQALLKEELEKPKDILEEMVLEKDEEICLLQKKASSNSGIQLYNEIKQLLFCEIQEKPLQKAFIAPSGNTYCEEVIDFYMNKPDPKDSGKLIKTKTRNLLVEEIYNCVQEFDKSFLKD